MHFSVFPSIPTLNTFLPLNGVALTPWRLPTQYTRTVLTQGFQVTPHFFEKCISKGIEGTEP